MQNCSQWMQKRKKRHFSTSLEIFLSFSKFQNIYILISLLVFIKWSKRSVAQAYYTQNESKAIHIQSTVRNGERVSLSTQTVRHMTKIMAHRGCIFFFKDHGKSYLMPQMLKFKKTLRSGEYEFNRAVCDFSVLSFKSAVSKCWPVEPILIHILVYLFWDDSFHFEELKEHWDTKFEFYIIKPGFIMLSCQDQHRKLEGDFGIFCDT